MQIKHRHVIYVQGYDPRGLAQYYRMFRTELRKFGKLYEVATTLGRPQIDLDSKVASWSIETKDSNWETRTDYDFLRWEDLIRSDLAWPIWRTVFRAVAIYARMLFGGIIAGFWKAHWRFAIFASYPHILLFIEALGSFGIAYLFGTGLYALGTPFVIVIAASVLVFVAVLGALLKYTEKRTYVLYLLSDAIFTWEFAHGRRPEWNERIDHFARYLVNVARSSSAEEVVIVGHSSGSFLSTEILARALELDPMLGQHGPSVTLLTVGANFPIVGFYDVARDFRDNLRRLAIEPSIDWIDGQSRKDVMNFYPFDPIAGHGIDAGVARRNPAIVSVRFREIIKPENYPAFRWKFFRVHFQFVMANEIPHAYDFFMIVCGPVPLTERIGFLEAESATTPGDAAPQEFIGNGAKLENRPNSALCALKKHDLQDCASWSF